VLRTENHEINRIDKDGKHLPKLMYDKIKIQHQFNITMEQVERRADVTSQLRNLARPYCYQLSNYVNVTSL